VPSRTRRDRPLKRSLAGEPSQFFDFNLLRKTGSCATLFSLVRTNCALGTPGEGTRRKFLFGIAITSRKIPIRTNKTKQIQAFLLGFAWLDLDLLGQIWIGRADFGFGCNKTAATCVSSGPSGGSRRMSLARAAKPLKRLKTTMGSYCEKLAWIWDRRHVRLGSAPRARCLGTSQPARYPHAARVRPLHKEVVTKIRDAAAASVLL